MNRLTFCEPNGNWGIVGMNDANQDEKMYGVASKLKDYEKTGLNPSDFRADEYEKKYVYKVFYFGEIDGKDLCHTILCENEAEAKRMELILINSGFKDVARNKYSWEIFIET